MSPALRGLTRAAALEGIRYARIQMTSLAGGLWPAWHEISVLGH